MPLGDVVRGPERGARLYQFGDFELRLSPLALFKNGRRTKLQLQPLKLLARLVALRGGLMTHKDIQDLLWPDHNVDFLRGTHVCIRQIRRALDDDAAQPAYIETVPGQGYRFRAPVVVTPTNAARGLFSTARLAMIAATGGILATAAIGIFIWRDAQVPAHSAAQDAYLRGTYLLAQGQSDAVRRSLRFFAQATTADPEFAPAYLSAGEAHFALGEFESAQIMGEAALQNDPNLAGAHLLLGRIEFGEWRWAEAENHFMAAIGLDATKAEAHQAIASIAMLTGRVELARRSMARAHQLDPASTLIAADYGWLEYALGHFGEAIDLCLQALELSPDSIDARICLIRAHDRAGQPDDARPHVRAIMARSNASPTEVEAVLSGDDNSVFAFERWRIGRYENPDRAEPVPLSLLASLHAFVGDEEAAISLLEQSLAAQEAGLPLTLLDPAFAGMISDPRFQRLCEDIGVSRPRLARS